ncbi:hypothetical protein [Cupriavidus sp. IDO]|uniref:hypothetical protein n=1 Tax=Cupriavidus sp. IDO TaxID=1539142 RepID=UPI001EE6AA48|nr:hypothetical protein [Cupriavidus sp. IDO]
MLDEFARVLPVAPFELCAEPAANRYWFSYFSGGAGSFRSWTAERFLEMLAGGHFCEDHEDAPKLAQVLQESARTGAGASVDIRVPAEGGLAWLRVVVAAPQPNGPGRLRWTGYWADVSEEHLQSEVLAEARWRSKTAAGRSPCSRAPLRTKPARRLQQCWVPWRSSAPPR